MATERMSVQDALWLTMDRPNNLMVVDGAMVLREQRSLADVQEVMLAVCARHPVFMRKPVRLGPSWGWADDEAFEIARHVTLADLGPDADVAALQRFVADQRSVALQKDRPLWVAFLVPALRLDDGTVGCAVAMRFHHAIADGVRVTQLMLSTCDAPDGVEVPMVARQGAGDGPFAPVDAVADGVQETLRVAVRSTAAAVGAAVGVAGDIAVSAVDATRAVTETTRAVAGDPVAAVASVPVALSTAPAAAMQAVGGLVRAGVDGVQDGISVVRRPDRLVDALEALGVGDHRALHNLSSVTKIMLADSGDAVWTGTPGARKAVAWSRPVPLAEVKRIGRAHEATVNDVLIAAVAGALRRYLAAHDDEVDEVVWMVPVNLKPFEENLPAELGNYFALVMLPMSLRDATFHERLADLHHRMARIKHSDEAVLTFGLQRTVSMSPTVVATFLTNFFANKAVGVLTNVPGPTGLLTYAGAPVEQVVGFAPCSGDQAMTTTIFSYNGGVTVGFATDADLVPDPEELVRLVVDELAEMGASPAGV